MLNISRVLHTAKNLFTEACIVYRAKKMLKADPTSPCFKSWSLSRLQISSYTRGPTVPVFLIYRLAFSFGSFAVKDYTDILLNKKQTKGKHQYLRKWFQA